MDTMTEQRSPLTVTNLLVFLNVVVFLCWIGLPTPFMAEHFLVSWDHVVGGRPWVLLSSVFSHTMVFHLLINMIVLMSFGPPLEKLMGWRRFLAFYLLAGFIGSVAHATTSRFLMESGDMPALGASGAIAGLLLVFSLAFPKARVLLFFIIPIPAIVAALAFIGIDIWGLIAQMDDGGLPIGHGAHLGGAFTGILYYLFRREAFRGAEDRIGL
ncbi:MAG: rhomboid family intramembrane serine protease [Gemmatimonadales bacterium]|nr:MAG: rhomboid family intramembrane serine protease [Gemmatimonadales bacterium]